MMMRIIKKIGCMIGSFFMIVILFPVDLIRYIAGFWKLSSQTKRMGIPVIGFLPCLSDKHKNAGGIDRHYFLQDIYMTKKIAAAHPDRHYDIGSRVDGFIGHLLTHCINVTMIDIRPLDIKVDGLDFIQADATNLHGIEDESISSLSTLHAIEHFGLGRYGDPISAESILSVLRSLQRVVKRGGVLYLSVPVGYRTGVIYNAHRVFHPQFIVDHLDKMELVMFAHIHDYRVDEYRGEDAYSCIMTRTFGDYDCGCFVFKKY